MTCVEGLVRSFVLKIHFKMSLKSLHVGDVVIHLKCCSEAVGYLRGMAQCKKVRLQDLEGEIVGCIHELSLSLSPLSPIEVNRPPLP